MPCSITYDCHISLSLRVSDINKESTLPSESVAVTPNGPSLDTDKETIVETKDIKEEGKYQILIKNLLCLQGQ